MFSGYDLFIVGRGEGHIFGRVCFRKSVERVGDTLILLYHEIVVVPAEIPFPDSLRLGMFVPETFERYGFSVFAKPGL